MFLSIVEWYEKGGFDDFECSTFCKEWELGSSPYTCRMSLHHSHNHGNAYCLEGPLGRVFQREIDLYTSSIPS
jgi:hypothetical protein